jgi:hypothetical protein
MRGAARRVLRTTRCYCRHAANLLALLVQKYKYRRSAARAQNDMLYAMRPQYHSVLVIHIYMCVYVCVYYIYIYIYIYIY